MNRQLTHATLLLAGTLAFVSCKKNKTEDPVPPPVNEEELITTVTLHFENATEHKHFEFSDPDGDGGAAPVIEADSLSADSVYAVHLELLNESVSPAVDITAEIQSEAEAHQFFFSASGTGIGFVYADADANGNPIGLLSTCTAGPAGTGTLTLTLRHGPDKFAAGVSGGDIANAGGETDIEITFPLVIE